MFVKNKTLSTQYPQILDTCLQDCLDHMFPGEGFVRFYMHDVVKDIKKNKSAAQIAKKHRISLELSEQICRLYLTHPGVTVDGILGKMGM